MAFKTHAKYVCMSINCSCGRWAGVVRHERSLRRRSLRNQGRPKADRVAGVRTTDRKDVNREPSVV